VFAQLQLKKHGIHQLIVIGQIAHTCIEATVRFAAELGYEVTVVKDAVADYSDEHMHAALDINLPNYASAIVTTEEIVALISNLWAGAGGIKKLPTTLPTQQKSRDCHSGRDLCRGGVSLRSSRASTDGVAVSE
jgi:hypothetical protein